MQPFFPLSYDRKFGLLLAAFFCLLGARAYLHHRTSAPQLLLLLALLVLAITAWQPRLLTPLSKAWLFLGKLMGKIVSPIVLGAIFFLCITPVGLLQRLLGRDALRMRTKSRKVRSYWIARNPPGPDASSFKNQF